MLLISAIRVCHVCRVGYSIICTTCDLVLSRIIIIYYIHLSTKFKSICINNVVHRISRRVLL